jgi:hypothetical protein
VAFHLVASFLPASARFLPSEVVRPEPSVEGLLE